MDTKSEVGKSIPPYLSYKTLQGFLQSLSQGVPERIDRSVMKTMSGTIQQHLLHALRYLRLIDQYGNTMRTLDDLVSATGAEQKLLLQQVLQEAYPFLFDGSFTLDRATPAQLNEQFRSAGASGDSIRKCAAFFLAAAKDADFKLSPYLKGSTGSRGTNSRPAAKSRSRKSKVVHTNGAGTRETPPPADNGQQRPPAQPATPSWTELLLAKFPALDPQWPDEVKSKWFDSFRELMQMQADQEADAFVEA
jgi:uncharacterized protein DUF5343